MAKELDASHNIEATAFAIDTPENSEGPLPNSVPKSPSLPLTGAGPLLMFHHDDVSGSDDNLQADHTVSTGSVPHVEDYMRWC